MSSLPFVVTKKLSNKEVQTVASVAAPDLFDFESDSKQVEQQRPPHFQFEKEKVEKLVSAVQGEDEAVREKYRIINTRTRRFRSLIQSLKNQIELHSKNISQKDQNELSERMVRELARAVDPASRHGKMTSLFSHQKYEHPVKVGLAKFTHSGSSPVDFDAIYSFGESLYLTNNDTTLYFQRVTAQNLVADEPIQLLHKNESIGKITLANGRFTSEENPNLTLMGPVSDDEKTIYLVRGLGSSSNAMNLKSLINPYDFSFIDVALSLPRLSQEEATNLLIYLYRSGFLSAFIRSKVCQLIYERDTTRVWPELLGRFVGVLDHDWFSTASKQMDMGELPTVIKNLAKLNQTAMYVFNIILEEFTGMDRGDPVEFVWELLCKSMFMNNFLGTDEASMRKRKQLESFFQNTKTKPKTSKTRAVTANVIEAVQQRANYKVPTKRFNPTDFLQHLITGHPEEIIAILKNIPRKNEESSPLFYPLALEIKEALLSYDEFDEHESAAESTGIISNVDYRQSETDTFSSSVSHNSRSSASRSSASRSSAASRSNASRSSAASRSNASHSSAASRASRASKASKSSHASKSNATRSTAASRSSNTRGKANKIEQLSENSSEASDTYGGSSQLSASSSSHASRSSRHSTAASQSSKKSQSKASAPSSQASSVYSKSSYSKKQSTQEPETYEEEELVEYEEEEEVVEEEDYEVMEEEEEEENEYVPPPQARKSRK